MPGPDRGAVRFVRALLRAGEAVVGDNSDVTIGGVRLSAIELRELASAGVVRMAGGRVRPRPEAKGWLRRKLLQPDDLAAQHRLEKRRVDGIRVNLSESPLTRLATAGTGEAAPYLDRHQVEAGERVRRLAERAQLQPRVTMSYSAAHTAGRKGPGHAAEITDMAAEARTELSRLHAVLPRECADVVLDVCGLSKGLQVIETERGWPRRSAKLVLRIGLEQLAQHYGLAPQAVGAPKRRRHAWLDDGARPTVFG